MAKIKLLDELTIKKIAAGEIIERPASVVKELVENSIDAGASNIIVEIMKGGKDYIRVTDDGEGFLEEDLNIAFKRHSTSKIKSAEDLCKIMSFGFRGEALSSISAVSKIEVLTKTKDRLSGIQAFIEEGNILSKNPVGCPKGTTIIVRDLFYNMPVRRDFLKSDSKESMYIDDILTRISLGNLNVSIKYIKDNKVVFYTSKNNSLISNIYTLLGREFSNNLFEIKLKSDKYSIYGYISNNTFYRGNRKYQYLYVNKRNVRNNIITTLIENKYKSLIPINKHPVYILFIDIDPSLINVNIHPTKQEVEFLNQEEINNSIEYVISETLNKNTYIQKINFKSDNKDKNYEELPLLYEKDYLDENQKVSDLLCDYYEKNKSEYFNLEENVKEYENEYSQIKNNTVKDECLSKDENKLFNSLTNYKIIGSIFSTYILVEDYINKKLLIIDQHAAHERILYEKYKKEFQSEKIIIQNLITPEIIELSLWEIEFINKNSKLFKSLGFIVETFGQKSVILRGVPMLFGIPQPKNFFLEVLDGIKGNLKNNYDIKLDKIMKIACSSAIKSGDKITQLEIKSLIEQLKKTDNPYTCPHGRPTIIELSKKDIEKEFKRII